MKDIKYLYIYIILLIILILLLYILFFYNTSFYINKIVQDNYIILEINNFLSNEECDEIIKNANEQKLHLSTVISDTNNIDTYDNNSRKSYTTWLNKHKNDINIDIKISKLATYLTNRPDTHFEDLQVVYYPPGGFFSPHYDATPITSDSKTKYREYTLIIYLNDVEEGGETEFPLINLIITPKKGKAILFRSINENQEIINESLHTGKPVIKGEKWICNKWIHFQPYS
jgi:prolyl 4-hydroxylase